MKLDTGGPAFPTIPYAGMTLLDYFAGVAMMALRPHPDFPAEVIAETAYKVARAMLAEKKRLEAEAKELPKVGKART